MESDDLRLVHKWLQSPHVRRWWSSRETYEVSDHPDYAALVGAGDGVAGVDLLIGDEALTGQGIGSEILRCFVDEVVFAPPTTRSCLADPDVRNVASIRAFQKAGFRPVREFLDPEDGQRHALVRRNRVEGPRSSRG